MKHSNKIKKPKKRLKFTRSLLHPADLPNPPPLVKKRIPLLDQINLNPSPKNDISWIHLFRSTSTDTLPLRRSLITSAPSVSISKPKEKIKIIKSPPKVKKGHLRTFSNSGILFEPKPLPAYYRSPVYLSKGISSSSNLSIPAIPSLHKKSFDMNIIPEKPNNLVTAQEVMKFIKYYNRPAFR